jgi:uncharacterized membrane protein YeaQ/YmgE (transglycosylase-associated protein family)
MPETFIGWLSLIGSLCFGIVLGWVTYRTLRRSQTNGLSDIATVLGALGGATVTALFRRDTGEFGAYCVGLLIGFFAYLIIAVRKDAPDWLGSEPIGSPGRSIPGGGTTTVNPPPTPGT